MIVDKPRDTSQGGTSPDELPGSRSQAGSTGAAYGLIRQAVLEGKFQPNEHLVEATLARHFGVGRQAVRTALTRLEQDGLVVREPNRGVRVKLITPEEAYELLEIRSVLEGLASRQAALIANAAQKEVLNSLLHQLEDYAQSSDLLAYSETNAELHRNIIAFAERPKLADLLTNLKAQAVRLRYRTALLPGRVMRSLDEHRAIVQAICDGDGARAEEAARFHVLSVAEVLVGSLTSTWTAS